jgi:recombinational DNA repair protein RecR
MRPNYETENQNFPRDTNLQAMRLHKMLRFQQIDEVILASFKNLLGDVEGNVTTTYCTGSVQSIPQTPCKNLLFFQQLNFDSYSGEFYCI